MSAGDERAFATRLTKAGAEVWRARGGEGLGDFVVIYKGKTYAVEVSSTAKPPHQLHKVDRLLKVDEKLSGTYEGVADTILGK